MRRAIGWSLRLLLLTSWLAPPLFGQQQTPPDCRGEEHRQFDFWLGEWEVTANGQLAGTNSITLTQAGCLLHEHWNGARGSTGESFNFYDRSSGKWHQVWIDNRGSVLRLSGRFSDRAMRLEGETSGPQGVVRQRITWSRNPDGSVRQLWENSRDGGSSWSAVFDGLYTRKR